MSEKDFCITIDYGGCLVETDGDAGEDVAAVAGGLDHCHGKVCQLASAPNIKVEIHLYPKPKSPIGSKIVFAFMFQMQKEFMYQHE